MIGVCPNSDRATHIRSYCQHVKYLLNPRGTKLCRVLHVKGGCRSSYSMSGLGTCTSLGLISTDHSDTVKPDSSICWSIMWHMYNFIRHHIIKKLSNKQKNKDDKCSTGYTYLQKILLHKRYLTTKSLLSFWARALGNSKSQCMRP